MNEVNDRKMKEKELNRKENELIEIQQNARLKLREMRMKRDIEVLKCIRIIIFYIFYTKLYLIF